jgi:hypothetical protein
MKFEELVFEVGYRAACKVYKRWGGELHRIPVTKTHQHKKIPLLLFQVNPTANWF